MLIGRRAPRLRRDTAQAPTPPPYGRMECINGHRERLVAYSGPFTYYVTLGCRDCFWLRAGQNQPERVQRFWNYMAHREHRTYKRVLAPMEMWARGIDAYQCARIKNACDFCRPKPVAPAVFEHWPRLSA